MRWTAERQTNEDNNQTMLSVRLTAPNAYITDAAFEVRVVNIAGQELETAIRPHGKDADGKFRIDGTDANRLQQQVWSFVTSATWKDHIEIKVKCLEAGEITLCGE